MPDAHQNPPPPVPPRLRLRVTATAESILRAGHPWLFAGSIREQNRPGHLGELAVVFDRQDRFLALGLFDPHSPLRVRLLHAGRPQNLDPAWWRGRLRAALDRRAGRFDALTTGYRLINGESDGWPGLVLDRYGSTLVIKLYSAVWLPRLGVGHPEGACPPALAPPQTSGLNPVAGPSLMTLLAEAFTLRSPQTSLDGPSQESTRADRIGGSEVVNAIVLRLSRNLQTLAREQFGIADGQVLFGQIPAGGVAFLESGLGFEADVVLGQKTGFFLDQRENRRQVGALARGRDVLNAFSFSGGFSLYAAHGQAKSVTDLDLSAHALASAARNFARNREHPAVAACGHERVQADAFAWLAQKPSRQFGLIVLDPPSLAKREAEREGAIRAYGRLAADSLRWLAPGGVLVAASCSAHVSAEEFFGAIRRAAEASGRAFMELQTTGHPPDHPATFPEGHYLKALYLRF